MNDVSKALIGVVVGFCLAEVRNWLNNWRRRQYAWRALEVEVRFFAAQSKVFMDKRTLRPNERVPIDVAFDRVKSVLADAMPSESDRESLLRYYAALSSFDLALSDDVSETDGIRWKRVAALASTLHAGPIVESVLEVAARQQGAGKKWLWGSLVVLTTAACLILLLAVGAQSDTVINRSFERSPLSGYIAASEVRATRSTSGVAYTRTFEIRLSDTDREPELTLAIRTGLNNPPFCGWRWGEDGRTFHFDAGAMKGHLQLVPVAQVGKKSETGLSTQPSATSRPISPSKSR